MDLSHTHWPAWAHSLKQTKLHGWVAWFLEAAGPLNLLTAQILHILTPFLGNPDQVSALTQTLEDDSETRAFINFLKGQS